MEVNLYISKIQVPNVFTSIPEYLIPGYYEINYSISTFNSILALAIRFLLITLEDFYFFRYVFVLCLELRHISNFIL